MHKLTQCRVLSYKDGDELEKLERQLSEWTRERGMTANLKAYSDAYAELIRIGKKFGFQSAEAHEQRDKMDPLWWALTEGEMDEARSIAADLNEEDA